MEADLNPRKSDRLSLKTAIRQAVDGRQTLSAGGLGIAVLCALDQCLKESGTHEESEEHPKVRIGVDWAIQIYLLLRLGVLRGSKRAIRVILCLM